MTPTVLLLGIGLILIIKGGDLFVDAATWMAEAFGIPKFIIGATVVSLATTLPELLVSAIAAIDGKVDMAIGNAVGSVTANIGLIMAIALLWMPTTIRRREYFMKCALMLGAAFLIALFGRHGMFGIFPSILLLMLFLIAVWENIIITKQTHCNSPEPDVPPDKQRKTVAVNILIFLIGAVAIVFGADLLVENGSQIALLVGIPERVISVTVIAIGTSLPELITTTTAIAKRQAALSIGNIVGANIIDLTLILPVCSLLYGNALPVSPQVAAVDLPACLLICAIAVVPTLLTRRFHRWQGIVLLFGYFGYLYITGFLMI
ncbi:MAG: calcium/sodium antiporter [Oscillospiraceae bacterium]|jgi:cation:H+ antiporter